MPLKRCTTKNGGSGWKFGDSGKCYLKKSDAIKQGIAEMGPEKFKQEMAKSGHLQDKEVLVALNKELDNQIESQLEYDATYAYISVKERVNIPLSDFGDPANRKYPVRSQEELDSAFKLVGRAPKSKQNAIRKRLKEIGKRKGYTIPDADQ